ncbi:MAG: class C sortase [Oscillospiraceae bacterium]|nr:class C sortase [Oscillospiraceae bacterium]
MKRKNSLSKIILILMLLIGLSLLLYPSVSDYWNSFTQSQAIINYAEQVAHLDTEQYDRIWQDAFAYNASLVGRRNDYLLSDEQRSEYNRLLNVAGNGIMGYIEIPSIGVELPIYHGTADSALAVAIGHLEWTSLPVGGADSHCVVSGHRGLPSAKLFTDLDQLALGDYFLLRILDETLTYEVDQIRIVEPTQTDDLLIQEGKDLCSLVTCTPYGINSHRLIVRGHRIENLEQAQTVRVNADAVVIEKLVVAPFLLAPVLLLALLSLLIPKRKRDNTKDRSHK